VTGRIDEETGRSQIKNICQIQYLLEGKAQVTNGWSQSLK